MRDPYRWGWKRYAQMFYPPFLRRYGIRVFRTNVFPFTPEVSYFGFRPLAGIRVFRTGTCARMCRVSQVSFRPLAGIRVFRTNWFLTEKEVPV